MSRFADQPRLSDDDRSRQSMDALRFERRSRPRHLVALAGLLVLVAGGVAWSSSRSLAAANKTLAYQQKVAAEVTEAAGKLNQLRAANAADGSRENEAVPQLRSRIAQAAADAGLKNPNVLPSAERPEIRRPGLNSIQRKFSYDVRDESLGALLKWMELATRDVPDLEVYSIKLQPEAQQWHLVVTFSRWERADSTGS
ncbi:MAG: hypothetical protein PSX37_05460 [bacterium]|nr:hypothetical protein [bacterium]